MNRKTQIFEAIVNIISESGFSHVTTTEIAKKIGISQPALYKHFKNRDEIILYFIDEVKKHLQKIVEYANRGNTLREKLENLYIAHFEFVENTKIIPKVVFSDEILDDRSTLKRDKFRDVCFNYYRKEIENIFLSYNVKNSKTCAQIIIGSFLSTALKWHLKGSTYNLKKEIPMLMDFWEKFLQI